MKKCLVIEMERKIFITGDAVGSSELSETGDIKIVVKVKNAVQAQSAKEGKSYRFVGEEVQ